MQDVAPDGFPQIDARALAHLDDAERLPAFERLANRRAADFEPFAQPALGRELLPKRDAGFFDIGRQRLDYSRIKGLAPDRAQKGRWRGGGFQRRPGQ